MEIKLRASVVLVWLAVLPASSVRADDHLKVSFDPPWHHETDMVVPDRGLTFTVAGIDDLADFHGDPIDPKLVLYVGGNYYFLMPLLVKAFVDDHPAFAGRIYWETLPPGLLLDQIKAGGIVTSGNMTWKVPADVYLASMEAVTHAISEELLVAPAIPYVTNTLTIMVPRGNPANIRGLRDLGAPGVRLSMPNPAFEGVARQIQASLTKAGGPKLEEEVYGAKVKDQTTFLTRIHHRQTPELLLQGHADAGVVWQSEARYQEAEGQSITNVDIPAAENTIGTYAGAVVNGALNADAARLWLDFLRTRTALGIFERFGFTPYRSP